MKKSFITSRAGVIQFSYNDKIEQNRNNLFAVCVYPKSSIYWLYEAIILTILYNTINLLFHLITYETERFYFRQTSILMSN